MSEPREQPAWTWQKLHLDFTHEDPNIWGDRSSETSCSYNGGLDDKGSDWFHVSDAEAEDNPPRTMMPLQLRDMLQLWKSYCEELRKNFMHLRAGGPLDA